MGQVGGELRQPCKAVFQAREHGVECLYGLFEFGRYVVSGHALIKAAWVDASHGVGQFA